MIDIHVHNIKQAPSKLFASRFEIDLKHLNPLIHELADHDTIIDGIEFIRNLFVAKDTDIEPILELYCNSNEYCFRDIKTQLVKNTGVIQVIDYGENLVKYKGQLADNLALAKKNHLKIFMGIDIGRTLAEIYDLLNNYLMFFDGIKLYPAISASMHGLEAVVQRCSKLQLPMLVHCSDGGIGKFKENNDPRKWNNVLYKYPNTVVCFGHGGGNNTQYQRTIAFYALEYENIYIDTAFHDDAIFETKSYFNDLRERIESNIFVMFGSDYPLHSIYYTYPELIDIYRSNLEQWQLDLIFNTHPLQFLL